MNNLICDEALYRQYLNGGGSALGYIVIGILAFLLGVCVTILCFRLRRIDREDAREKESEGRDGVD